MEFPPEALFIAALDLLIAAGWIAIFVRRSRFPRRIAMVSAAVGAWLFGLGLALRHVHEVGNVAATMGIGDPSSMAGHFGDSLIIAASATTGLFWLTVLGVIGMALPEKKQREVAVS